MTWGSEAPATPQEPRAPGAQQQPTAFPPPGPVPGGPVPPQGVPPYPPPPDAWAGPPPPPRATYPVAPPEPMWMPPPAYPLAPDAHPVNISFDREAGISRLWGIPLIGQTIRLILLIPHFIVFMLIGFVAAIQLLVSWIPVLILGRYPGWGYRWTGGFLAYGQRISAYAYLLAAPYPPFALEPDFYPIVVRYDEGVRINRLWGIPIVGYLVRAIVLIPHFIVLTLLAILAGFLMLFVWAPVLIFGRQADLMYTIIGGFFRWSLRVSAYGLLMVDRYPPFSLGEDDPRL